MNKKQQKDLELTSTIVKRRFYYGNYESLY